MSYLDRRGRPLTVYEWRLLLDDPRYARLASDDVGEWTVNTTWLGTDPLFETAVIGRVDPAVAERVASYSDELEALAGHRAAVRRFRRAGSAAG